MAEVLSQEELEKILKQAEKQKTKEDNHYEPKASPVHFDCFDVCSKNQAVEIILLFKTIFHNLSVYFSDEFDKIFSMKVDMLDYLPYEQISSMTPNHAVFCHSKWDGIPVLLEFDPTVIFDLFLEKDIQEGTNPVLTPFESKVILNEVYFPIMNQFIATFSANTKEAIKFPEENSIMSYETLFPGVGILPDEKVFYITLEANISQHGGFMNIIFPVSFFKKFLLGKNIIKTNGSEELVKQINPESETAYVSFGDIDLYETWPFFEGQMIVLNKNPGEELDIVDRKTGKVLGKGIPVVIDDEKMGIRITEYTEIKSFKDENESK